MAVTESGHRASRQIDDLYRAHGADVYRYAYAVLGNRADAEDVTQTTFLNAYRALEQGVHPRKPSNWLLAIASNAIKQRFRQEQARPREVELDERIAGSGPDDDHDGPSVGELLTALSKIPPQQRQAIVLREFEGRSYAEIAEILGVTTSALETLLFRARRSLAEELEHQLTCTEAQLAISRSVDGRLGRKERRRLRDHLSECPDCAGFARIQSKHRTALRGLALVPVPVSLTLFKGLEGSASAAVIPAGAAVAGGVGAGATAVGATTAGSAGGGLLASGLGLKAAAVVAAASVAGGVGVAGSTEVDAPPSKARAAETQPGKRTGQVAPRGVLVPGNGVAVGKANAPGQAKAAERNGNAAVAKARAMARAKARAQAARIQRAQKANGTARANAPGRDVSAAKRAAATARKQTTKPVRPAAAATSTNGEKTKTVPSAVQKPAGSATAGSSAGTKGAGKPASAKPASAKPAKAQSAKGPK